jgi:hypothetical protein
MRAKRDKSRILNSVLRKDSGVGRTAPVRVVKDHLLILEPESHGYNPYDKAPRPPSTELEVAKTIEKRLLRKSTNGS